MSAMGEGEKLVTNLQITCAWIAQFEWWTKNSWLNVCDIPRMWHGCCVFVKDIPSLCEVFLVFIHIGVMLKLVLVYTEVHNKTLNSSVTYVAQ